MEQRIRTVKKPIHLQKTLALAVVKATEKKSLEKKSLKSH